MDPDPELGKFKAGSGSGYGINSFGSTSLLFWVPNTYRGIIVGDPNTLNLDPDPGFWPNSDPDPDPGPDLDLG